jgi:SAM-dependent methyltransferase
MLKYYSENLFAERLEMCYRLAPPRVTRYLDAEIDFVRQRIKPGDKVLEIGCGYGRVLKSIYPAAKYVIGIDNAVDTLFYGHSLLLPGSCSLLAMDAYKQGFKSETFDLVFCIQNGISAFGGNPEMLINESVRITKKGGTVLFSSYSDKFWEHRLEWFKIQSENYLIGEIDYDLTGDGTIVCKDGFRATTFNSERFRLLTSSIHGSISIREIDDSSIFCEIILD